MLINFLMKVLERFASEFNIFQTSTKRKIESTQNKIDYRMPLSHEIASNKSF